MFLDFKENIELLEKVILNFVLTADDNDILVKPKNLDVLSKGEMLGLLKSYYFSDEQHQEVYKLAKEYHKNYQRLPSRKEIKDMLALNNSFTSASDVDSIFNINMAEYSFKFLYDYTQSFVLYKNFNSAITSMVAELKTQEITPSNIDKIVNKTRNDLSSKLSISFSTKSEGLDFFNPESHIQPFKAGTPTGFEFIDKALDGGWNPKTLVVFQGRPKVGKSMVLSNVAARAVLRGVNTGVATFELSKEAYTKRVGANMLNIPYKEYNDMISKESLGKVTAKLKRLKEINPNIGELRIAQFGTGAATALDVENYFLKQEQLSGKKFHVIVVDYINIMRPIDAKEGMYEKIKVISEELRAVAIRNEWTIVTATQVKREAVTDNDLGMEDVAESFGLIHTVDTLFGLMRSPLEKRMKIKVIANRDGGFTESYQIYELNYDFARMTECTGAADVYYSDEDQAADLKQEMNQQYSNVGTLDDADFGMDFGDKPPVEEPRKLIPIAEAEARFAPVAETEEESFGVDEELPFDPDPIPAKEDDPFADVPPVVSNEVNHDIDYDDLLNSI